MDLSRLLRPGPIVAVVVVVGLWLVAPEIFTGTFSDLNTFLLVLAAAAAVAGWVVVVHRFVSPRELRWGLIGVPLGVLAWVVLWPYLRAPTEVDEAFPLVVTTADADESTSATTTSAPTTTAPTTTVTPTTTAAPTTTVTPTTSVAPTTTTPPTTTTAAPAGPIELRRSGFQGLTGHRGSGDAVLYELEDGSVLLRFEEVDIGSGPALNVWVVPGSDVRSLSGGTYVAPLTAERGNQNYTVPAGVDLTTGSWTVLVWCDTFSVEVANATLA